MKQRPGPCSHLFVILLAAILLNACSGTRIIPTDNEIRAAAERQVRLNEDRHRRLVKKLASRIRLNALNSHAEGSVAYDILILSGGGQHGAFGAGFLRGWNESESNERRQPEFDMVTGISTGSLISPFAFSGTSEDYSAVNKVYESADDHFAHRRGILFFLPWRDAFFTPSGLKELIDEKFNRSMFDMVKNANNEHRLLLIGTTDLDLGVMHIWDMGHEANNNESTAALNKMRDIFLASSSIPVIFPPVMLDGRLHVDGGTSEQFFLLSDVIKDALEATNLDEEGRLTIRLWVIVNGKINAGLQPVDNTWPSVAKRSLTILTHENTVSQLRRIELFSHSLNVKTPGLLEFYFVSIPEEYPLEKTDKIFDHEIILKIEQLGYEMGLDPSSWRSTTLSPEEFQPVR